MSMQSIQKKLGARIAAKSEAGFTLIELLVVMLILGILAAIALPAFFNQKSKATDAKAKENAHSAQVAMETCGTESNTGYAACNTVTILRAIEPTLPVAPSGSNEGLTISGTSTTAYTVSVTAANTKDVFSITRAAGSLTYTCTVPETATNRGGCPGTGVAAGTWG